MKPRRASLKGAVILPVFLVATAVVLAGCVRSKVIVTSEPSNAEVSMNGVALGKTPLEQPFTWYWYYDFIGAKEGYKTTGIRERFRAPIYLWPGADLLMEMMPFYVKDTKKVHLVLPQVDARPAPVYSSE
ncbi:hypothetical protein BH09SUM1_BH09SUM1_25850 [soil metagenome]